MDVAKKYQSNTKRKIRMKKFINKILCLFLLTGFFLTSEQVLALVPYYYLPTIKNLKKESLNIGKTAYQLLYFGQLKEGLNLAKLAVKIYESDEQLWLILSEAQIANELYDDALISLRKAEKINSNISQIHFTKSTIYLQKGERNNAKISLEAGLKIEPNNYKAIFQLGNIFLMEKNYSSAIGSFNSAIKIKPDFWQATNNIALAYFEQDKINKSIEFFEKTISIEDNAEPLLGLAACLSINDIDSAITLAKKALTKNPKYVNSYYREEQLWGGKLQSSTELLLKNKQMEEDVQLAKSKINEIS